MPRNSSVKPMAHAMERRDNPNAPSTHDDGKEIDEENHQGHDHQQRPLKCFKFGAVRQTQVKGNSMPANREHQAADQQHDEADDETEFDALLNLGTGRR